MQRLEGKTAIVTGATLGIGAAISRRLGEEGASVVLVARTQEPGERLAGELKGAVFVQGDVADAEVADRAVATALRTGRLDVLVNNAGMDFTGELLETREEDARRVFETNFYGALWMLVRVGAQLRARGGGSIINVTSRLASIGVPTMAVYAASKGALLALTRNAAVELAPFGIRVNAVAPGFTSTQLLREYVAAQPDPEAFAGRLTAAIPQGRFGEPSEVAATVAFLAADESAHITGASIPVDGGYTAA